MKRVGISLLLLIGILGGPINVQANGEQEANLGRAQALIDSGEREEAVRLLRQAYEQNAQNFEAIERQIAQVRDTSQEFSALIVDLVDTLRNRPDDLDNMLAIIARLEELNEFPTLELKKRISATRDLALVAAERGIMLEILQDAQRLLNTKAYVPALRRYLDGFDLQRESFLTRYGADSRSAELSASIEQMRTHVDQIDAQYFNVNDLLADFEMQIDDADLGGVDRILTDISVVASDLIPILTAVIETAKDIEEVAASFEPNESEEPIEWHPVFVNISANGRPQYQSTEGIVAGIGRMQSDIRMHISESAIERVRQSIDEALVFYTETEFETANQAFIRARQLSAIVLNGIATIASTATTAQDSVDTVIDTIDDVIFQRIYLYNYALTDALEPLAALSVAQVGTKSHTNWVAGLGSQDTVRNIARLNTNFETRVANLTQVSERIRSINVTWERQRATLTLFDVGLRSERTNAWMETVTRLFDVARQTFTEQKAAALDYYTRQGLPQYQIELAAGKRDVERAKNLIDGIRQTDNQNDEVPVIYRFPDRAIAILSGRLNSLEESIDFIDLTIADLIEDDTDTEVLSLTNANNELVAVRNEITNVLEQGNRQLDRARERFQRAIALRTEGDRLVGQTRQAIQNQQDDRATDVWNRARETYFQSTELQEDAALRQQTDQVIATLGDGIVDLQNRAIVQRVRRLLTESSAQFDSENYEEAEDLLNEAEALWDNTNITENPEIERLRRFTNIALLVERERDLRPIDPLYPVLSNYLNIAQEDYTSARDLLSVGNSSTAAPFLTRANDNLNNVTAVRPYNWEARILELQIAQLNNNEDFAAIFDRRYRDAIAQRENDPREALISLETLHTINPNYPGLQSNIEAIEIQLGLRTPPIDTSGIQQSNQLLAQARNLAQRGGDVQILAAIDLLEQAVVVNPRNTIAQLELDTLRINRGGQSSATLNSSDEQLFRRAQTLTVQGRVAQAFAVVERLWGSPQNQLYPPLVSLRARLTVQLGI